MQPRREARFCLWAVDLGSAPISSPAGAVISIMPMLIVFALLRRHIKKGIATSGLRG
jgi:hypothetical protein